MQGEKWVSDLMEPLRGGRYRLPAKIGNRIYEVVQSKGPIHGRAFVDVILEALDRADEFRVRREE